MNLYTIKINTGVVYYIAAKSYAEAEQLYLKHNPNKSITYIQLISSQLILP